MTVVYLCSSCSVCSSTPLTFSSSSVLLCMNEFISAKISALALTFPRNKRGIINSLQLTNSVKRSVLPRSGLSRETCSDHQLDLRGKFSVLQRSFHRLVTQKEGKIAWPESVGNLDWRVLWFYYFTKKDVLGNIGLRDTGPNAARYVLKRQRANNPEQGLSKLQVSAGVVH